MIEVDVWEHLFDLIIVLLSRARQIITKRRAEIKAGHLCDYITKLI